MSIIEYIKERGGYVRAMDVESRAMYKQLLSEVTKGNVVRIRNGIYALPEDMAKTMVDVGTEGQVPVSDRIGTEGQVPVSDRIGTEGQVPVSDRI